MSRSESEFVTVARVRKVHGRRGEVAAEILTDFPERFEAGQWFWMSGSQPPQRLFLEQCRFHKGLALLKFQGTESIPAAVSLVGRELLIPRSERRPAPPGAFYISDLIGCTVLEGNQNLGTVEALEGSSGTSCLRVAGSEGELLIPFAQDICTGLDVAHRQIHVKLPEGLRQLNREEASRRARRIRSRHPRRQQR